MVFLGQLILGERKMYLVKSCSKGRNPKQCGTLKIGSLTEYRDSENKEVEDREEGFYRINLDLKKKWISVNLFNHLNGAHDSSLSASIYHLGMNGNYDGGVIVDYQADYSWVNLNRLIFCITKVENVDDAKGIFSGYDDSWSISYNKITWMKNAMGEAILEQVKDRVAKGELIFGSNVSDPNKLTIRSYAQDIIYQERDLHLGNSDIDAMSDTLISLFENVKFIKPVNFKKEKELRLVFDFYYNGDIVFPQINSLIIPAGSVVPLID